MTLTQQQVRSILLAEGIPALGWQLPDLSFETVSAQWVEENYLARIASLPPELVTTLDVGGGLTRRVPLWIAEAGDCETWAIIFSAYGYIGNILKAVQSGQPRGGLAYGPLFYVSIPRAECRYRAGMHSIQWYIDNDGQFRTYEEGTGDALELLPQEKATATFGLCA